MYLFSHKLFLISFLIFLIPNFFNFFHYFQHKDLRTVNILLNEALQPKVSNFEFDMPENREIIPPEIQNDFTMFSRKSDVYVIEKILF